MRIYKEWHFQIMPKYELGYFVEKCQEFGRFPEVKVKTINALLDNF